jgi:hypothetical protein
MIMSAITHMISIIELSNQFELESVIALTPNISIVNYASLFVQRSIDVPLELNPAS